MGNYYSNEVNDAANEDAANYRVNNNKTTTSISFEYKTKITGKTSDIASRLETKVPLKTLSKFWRSLDLPLINFEIKLDLSWSKDCVFSEILGTSVVPANPTANPLTDSVPATETTGATLHITNTSY